MLGTLLMALRTLAAWLRATTFFVHGIEGWRRGGIIKTFGFLPHNTATDETFERAQFTLIFVRDETDGVADGVRATGAADAVDVILGLHRKIIIHDVRNPVHVNAARRDIRRDQHADRAGFEIFQRLEPLVLRTVGM